LRRIPVGSVIGPSFSADKHLIEEIVNQMIDNLVEGMKGCAKEIRGALGVSFWQGREEPGKAPNAR
jgi:hypothetical protein